MSPKKQRLWYMVLLVAFVGGTALIILSTLNNHLLFFMTPSDVLALNPTEPIRLGGMVKEGSLHRQPDGPLVTFMVYDEKHEIPVRYQGITPDLFREGQGVVAEGRWLGGVFEATHLLAKHDENYMPREVAEALKEKGQWRPQTQERRTP